MIKLSEFQIANISIRDFILTFISYTIKYLKRNDLTI
jgi:hypothetical protein